MKTVALIFSLCALVHAGHSAPRNKRNLHNYAPSYSRYTLEYQPVYQHYPPPVETHYPVEDTYPVHYPVQTHYPGESHYPVGSHYPSVGTQYPVIGSHYEVEVKPPEDTVITDSVRSSNTVYTVTQPVTYRYAVAQPVVQRTRVVSPGVVYPKYYASVKNSLW